MILLELNTLSLYKGISVLGYVLAALFLIASVAVFFFMDIRGVYSYLSGKKQQKGIMEMREKQENQASNKPKPVPPTSTGNMGFAPPPPKRNGKKPRGETQYNIKTPPPQPTAAEEEEATGVLNPAPVQSPDKVDEDATGVLNAQNNPTSLANDEHTDVLSPADNPVAAPRHSSNIGRFEIIKEVMEIHTDKVL